MGFLSALMIADFDLVTASKNVRQGFINHVLDIMDVKKRDRIKSVVGIRDKLEPFVGNPFRALPTVLFATRLGNSMDLVAKFRNVMTNV
ncbi:unnamed protein product [Clonostachys rhizophaga]|uniref:Uncharacterized protein n=1 Tax=Clonostachys rhizophaga TaxID=160324 RepID=A0A9N9VUW8_9HYPO|nr:unnamed protein product [Clonostachys rhizophaga]